MTPLPPTPKTLGAVSDGLDHPVSVVSPGTGSPTEDPRAASGIRGTPVSGKENGSEHTITGDHS